MKKMYLLGAAVIMTMAFRSECYSQDSHFSQFYANPLYLNPAMAGSSRCPSLHMNYRNQWPALSGNFVTASASYDQYVKSAEGGLGFYILRDQAGQSTYTVHQAAAMYSYHQDITRSTKVQFGVQAAFIQRTLDWDKLIFGDQLDPKMGLMWNTKEQRPVDSKSMVDISSGIVINNKHIFGGVAVHHLTEPDEAFMNLGESKLPMKYTIHAGMNFYQHGNKRPSLSPNVIYQRQGDFKQLNMGLYWDKEPLVFGIWSRMIERDAVILTVGLKGDKYQLGYTYDATISKLATFSAGAHELSLSFLFECKNRPKKFRTMFCPSF
ncbi:MAG: type IX secretion system membrane protein PorP/SprF [Flavobacteriales bacterium]|nr:type IX secretion system membrane protein PorP/SprF [Flavobacteriales bacterium]